MQGKQSIYVLRHGKSDWKADYGSDHDRPLNKRGRQASGIIGDFLRQIDQVPDRILSSTAIRARTTVEIAADRGDWPTPIELEPRLYMASISDLYDCIAACPATSRSLLLVGHEPVSSGIISSLTGECRLRFPTASLARVDCHPEPWSAIRPGSGTLIWLVTPKILKPAVVD